jgi:KaiC/GvpD/RAD55 family RecA-like ATPase
MKLIDILKEKDEDLYNKFKATQIRIRDELASFWQNYAQNFTNHGQHHFKAIEENLNYFIPPEIKMTLHPHEIFLLLIGVWTHDVGMMRKKEETETLNEIRKKHNERSEEFVKDNRNLLNINWEEAYVVSQLCLGHRYVVDINKITENMMIGNTKVRIRFLTSLLRLGDAFDVTAARAPEWAFNALHLDEESEYHWKRHSKITGISYEHENRKIVVNGLIEKPEEKKLVKDMVEELNKELKSVQDVLLDHRIFYTKVEQETKEFLVTEEKAKKPEKKIETFEDLYRGLESYREEDKDIFYGREIEIIQLMSYIRKYPLVILYGQSGVGKTSVINAGIIPQLKSDEYDIIYIRCYKQPVKDIKSGLTNLYKNISSEEGNKKNRLVELIPEAQRNLEKKLIIIIDQAEELFTLTDEEQRNELMEVLSKTENVTGFENITFILSLRHDHLGNTLSWFNTNHISVKNYMYEILGLTEKTAEEIIRNSGTSLKLEYEDGIIDNITGEMAKLSGGKYVYPPYLQIVNWKLGSEIEKIEGAKKLTNELYKEIAGTEDGNKSEKIISDYFADTMYKDFSEYRKGYAHKMLKAFTTFDGRRESPKTIKDICMEINAEENEIKIIMEAMIKKRIINVLTDAHTDINKYELMHDFLAKKIASEFDEKEGEIKRILTTSKPLMNTMKILIDKGDWQSLIVMQDSVWGIVKEINELRAQFFDLIEKSINEAIYQENYNEAVLMYNNLIDNQHEINVLRIEPITQWETKANLNLDKGELEQSNCFREMEISLRKKFSKFDQNFVESLEKRYNELIDGREFAKANCLMGTIINCRKELKSLPIELAEPMEKLVDELIEINEFEPLDIMFEHIIEVRSANNQMTMELASSINTAIERATYNGREDLAEKMFHKISQVRKDLREVQLKLEGEEQRKKMKELKDLEKQLQDRHKEIENSKESQAFKTMEELEAKMQEREMFLKQKEIELKEMEDKMREPVVINVTQEVKAKPEVDDQVFEAELEMERTIEAEKEIMNVRSGVRRLDDMLYGGYPLNSNILLYGPPFCGKQTLMNLFIVDGIKRGVPGIFVLLDKTPSEIRDGLDKILPKREAYESKGLILFIDAYSKAMGLEEEEEFTVHIDQPTNTNQILEATKNLIKSLSQTNRYYKLAFSSVSTMMAYLDSVQTYRFLQNFTALNKKYSGVGLFNLESGMFNESDIQTLKHLTNGVIEFKLENQRHFLRVEGIGEARTRKWMEYSHSLKDLMIRGSFAVDHIS